MLTFKKSKSDILNVDNSEYSHTYSSWLIILKLEIIIKHSVVKTTEQ